ncbi:hypothetical protein [Synechocystis sp. LKSZ1]|uniref:hypothetical protein n=1 Tax=Synechocystis sp. LKSZ1 TaxID=3144951 RepID=UPI00336BD99C
MGVLLNTLGPRVFYTVKCKRKQKDSFSSPASDTDYYPSGIEKEAKIMFTKFNRVLLASGLVLTSLVGFGSAAFAEGAGSGTGAAIGVSLPEMNTLLWTPTNTSTNPLPLTIHTGEGLANGTKVGQVNVQANHSGGFTVAVTSTNQGVLIKGSSTKAYDKMAYTLYYDGSPVTLDSSGVGTAESHNELVTECASSNGCTRDVGVQILQEQVEGKAYGTYTDTLTFTLTQP